VRLLFSICSRLTSATAAGKAYDAGAAHDDATLLQRGERPIERLGCQPELGGHVLERAPEGEDAFRGAVEAQELKDALRRRAQMLDLVAQPQPLELDREFPGERPERFRLRPQLARQLLLRIDQDLPGGLRDGVAELEGRGITTRASAREGTSGSCRPW
jgi:hypothetical protein